MVIMVILMGLILLIHLISKAEITSQTDDDGEIDNVEINGTIKVFQQFLENP